LLKGVTHTRVYFKSSSYLKSKLNKWYQKIHLAMDFIIEIILLNQQ
jgi:hypothetical protein